MQEIIAIFLRVFAPGAKKKKNGFATALDTIYYVCVSSADALGWCSERGNIQGGA